MDKIFIYGVITKGKSKLITCVREKNKERWLFFWMTNNKDFIQELHEKLKAEVIDLRED